MPAALSITPDGRWFQVPGYCRQPTRGLVRAGLAAIWTAQPLERLQQLAAAPADAHPPVVRGPRGRVARFVGAHPSAFLRDHLHNWWETDLETAALADPEPATAPALATAELVGAPAVLEPEPAPPAPDPEPPASWPEPEPAAPPEPPQGDGMAAVIQQGVAAIVEQLQSRGLLAGAAGLAVLPTEAVLIDPRRFQFRQVSHHGDLRAVSRWNPDLAGVLSVWRDPADGRVFVVDGHHRAGLARRLEVPTLAVRFLEASSAQEARAIGAAINIAGGHATAIDTAKLLRDGGQSPEQLTAYGLPPGGRLVRDGLALAQLAPELFERTAMGGMALEMGLALAAAGPNHTLQRDLARVAKRNTWAAASVREAAEMASLATVSTTAGEGLLPGLELEASNLGELLEVRAAIRNSLRAEIRALGTATRSRSAAVLESAGSLIDREGSQAARSQTQVVADTFARLVNHAGPLADLVKLLASEVGPERSAQAVVTEHLDLVRNAIASELGSLGL